MLRGRSKKIPLSEVIRLRDTKQHGLFAPIIIGGGKGSTGTHLFLETTCAMGFVSLHYAVGCLPKSAMVLRKRARQLSNEVFDASNDDDDDDEEDDGDNSNDENDDVNDGDDNDGTNHQAERIKMTCPVPIEYFRNPFRELVRYHSFLAKSCLKLGNIGDAVSFRERTLRYLEKIIVWGKENKVTLALHDEPYPLLIPEILKIVQQHYGSPNEGGRNSTVKPIILLSERDPRKYTRRRTKIHGQYSWICRPTNDLLRTKSPEVIAIDSMDDVTLEGGAFDMLRCMDRAAHGQNKTQTRTPQMESIFYSYKEANRNESQFIVDTMEQYQNTVRTSAIFSYNMFERESRTSVSVLAAQIEQAMIEALMGENGRQIRMEEGVDFLGMEHLFASAGMPGMNTSRTAHRRQDQEFLNKNATENVRPVNLDSSAFTKIVLVHLFRKKIIPSSGVRLAKIEKECKDIKTKKMNI